MKESLFHIHTHRCGHASKDSDRAYVEKAISLGAKEIVFTDHCPFPGDLFPYRMPYGALEEYISSLGKLKERFKNQISVKIGLEAEYLPSYDDFYKELKNRSEIDILILGQHFYEHEDGTFGYADVTKEAEIRGFTKATIEGIHSGFFDVVAHPDRYMDRVEVWNEEADAFSKEIAKAAEQMQVTLEHNVTSMLSGRLYRPEFWRNVSSNVKTIYGLDAHSVGDMVMLYETAKKE